METTYLYCWCRSVGVVVPMATISDGRARALYSVYLYREYGEVCCSRFCVRPAPLTHTHTDTRRV